MMKKFVWTLGLLFVASMAQAQTSPCAPVASGVKYNPTKVYVESADHNAVVVGSTTPAITEYEIGVFLDGVNPTTGQPVTRIVLLKAAFSAVAGFANCYLAQPSELLALPVGQLFRAVSKARRTGSLPAESAWGGQTVDPFARPSVLTAPTATVVTP